MQLIIRGDKIEVTKAMNDYVSEKIKKLEKYLEEASEVRANILIKVNGLRQKVEITIPLKSVILRAEAVENDFYAAVDLIIDKLERQIRKNKTKLASRAMKFNKRDFIFDSIETLEDEDDNLIRRKTIEMKPMDEEEAILQMELLNHQFYLYKDATTNKPMVVYKRNDGGYGIIETE